MLCKKWGVFLFSRRGENNKFSFGQDISFFPSNSRAKLLHSCARFFYLCYSDYYHPFANLYMPLIDVLYMFSNVLTAKAICSLKRPTFKNTTFPLFYINHVHSDFLISHTADGKKTLQNVPLGWSNVWLLAGYVIAFSLLLYSFALLLS